MYAHTRPRLPDFDHDEISMVHRGSLVPCEVARMASAVLGRWRLSQQSARYQLIALLHSCVGSVQMTFSGGTMEHVLPTTCRRTPGCIPVRSTGLTDRRSGQSDALHPARASAKCRSVYTTRPRACARLVEAFFGRHI